MSENNNTNTDTNPSSLVDILTEAVNSAIDADQNAIDTYYTKLADYTLNENGLETLDCKVKSEDGKDVIVSIPRLVLMPLPLLHIQEATFDVEGEWEVEESSKMSTEVQQKEEETRVARALGNGLRAGLANAIKANQIRAVKIPRIRLLRPVQSKSETETNSSNSGSSSSESKQSIKMSINVKMGQAEMPAGLVNLIQAVSNTIQVKPRLETEDYNRKGETTEQEEN